MNSDPDIVSGGKKIIYVVLGLLVGFCDPFFVIFHMNYFDFKSLPFDDFLFLQFIVLVGLIVAIICLLGGKKKEVTRFLISVCIGLVPLFILFCVLAYFWGGRGY